MNKEIRWRQRFQNFEQAFHQLQSAIRRFDQLDDLAIAGNRVSEETALNLKRILNHELPIPYHVDVVHLESVTNPALKAYIADQGKTLWNREDDPPGESKKEDKPPGDFERENKPPGKSKNEDKPPGASKK